MHVGILGVGRIGSFHAQTLADLDRVDKISVWDPRHDAVEAVCERIPAQPAHSPAALFEADLDAILICSGSATHAQLLTEAVRRGIPAFCEKPIATDVDATRQLVGLVDASSVPVTVGFQRRSDPAYRALKRRIDDGELGRLYLARLVVGDDAPPPADYLANSGGLFVDQSVHDFDILRYLTGQEIIEVYAAGAALTTADGFAATGDADTAVTLLTCSGGTLASLTSSRHSAGGYDVRVELAGTRGLRAVGLNESRPAADGVMELAMPRGGFVPRFAAAYRAEIDRFLDWVEGRSENPCSVHDALAAVEVACAATASRTSGRPVRLDAD